ncbi:hypothetical protein PAPYR_9299 [Paratrimastix pyriformis]|uniref:Protein kinase domain-containing protein n=1 Tax=Paratrimastix pyriformis TaxID=342808 RepID=A0ABQ8U8S2_9EUKA|nr:hypothetical protein PAPYR_9299 [Paratrimastix pyriformis]
MEAPANRLEAFRNLVRSLPLSEDKKANLLRRTEQYLQLLSDSCPSDVQLAACFRADFFCGCESYELAIFVHHNYPPHVPIAPVAVAAPVAPQSNAGTLLETLLRGLPSASTVAQPEGRAALLQRHGEGKLHMTQLGQVPFPPQLVERAFMEFEQEFHSPDPPDYQLTQCLQAFSDVAVRAAQGTWDERTLQEEARDPLCGLLGVPLASQSVAGGHCDLLAYMVDPRHPAMIIAFKREPNGGAAYEIALRYANLWRGHALGACPSFLVQVGGASVTVAAAITTSTAVLIEELASVKVLPFCSGRDLRPALKLFTALRHALVRLTQSIRALAPNEEPRDDTEVPSGGTDEAFPFFFLDQQAVSPAPQPVASSTSSSSSSPAPVASSTSSSDPDRPAAPPFRFRVGRRLERIDETLCFRTCLPAGPAASPVVVKVVRGRYGLQAHLAAMRAHVAPPLIACYALPTMQPLFLAGTAPAPPPAAPDPTGDYILVIMAEVSFTPWSRLSPARREALVPHLEAAVRQLHESDLVHGDLRGRNVGLADASPDAASLCLVDFDWAGRVGTARYPPFLNSAIKWPDGAVSEGLIGKEHDDCWLALLRKSDEPGPE